MRHYYFIFLLVLGSVGLNAASYLTGDTIRSPDRTKTWTLPAASAALAPLASPTFSGTITTPLTASRLMVTGASSELAVNSVTATEAGYLGGVTSAIQTQMNLKSPLASPSFTGDVTMAGNLLLPTTSATVGSLDVNSTRVLHFYGTQNTFLGSGAANYTMTGTGDNVFIGYTAGSGSTSGTRNTCVGSLSCTTNSTTASNNTCIGYNCQMNSTSIAGAMAFGTGAQAYTSNTVGFGSSTAINDVYFGKGQFSATALVVGLNATGGSGTDKVGGDLSINGGQSTGAGTAGKILFKTAPVSASGASVNALVERGGFDGVGCFYQKGTSSGTVSYCPAAAAGTYNWNWPITAGSAGQTLTSQGGGSTAMTWVSTLTNPMTTLGDIIYSTDGSGTAGRLGIGATVGSAFMSGGAGVAPYWSVVTSADELTNIGLTTSVGSSALTIALKQADGSTDCSTTSAACKVGMRASTLATGSYTQRTVTGALSVVVTSGGTLGCASAVACTIWVYAIDNAGAIELAVSQTLFPETDRFTTTAMDSASDSNRVVYSTTARTNVAGRVVGKILITEATAGTWASNSTQLDLNPRLKDPISVRYTTAAGASVANTGYTRIDFATKVQDSHNAVTTGTWTFTAPRTGYYRISAKVLFASSLYAVGNSIDLQMISTTATVALDYYQVQAAVTEFAGADGTTTQLLTAGDTVYINIGNARTTGATNLHNDASHVYVDINSID